MKTFTGCAAGTEKWTAEEERTLRDLYRGRMIQRELTAALPGRTPAAIYHRAIKLGLRERFRWTEEDDKRLRNLWEDGLSLATIAKTLGRTQKAVYWRTYHNLRLPLGPPQGCEWVTTAGRRSGYSDKTFRRILGWAGVQVKLARSVGYGHKNRLRYVDSFDADRAVEAWGQTETTTQAARRLGIDGQRLRNRLKKLGVITSKARHVRITPDQVDAANALARYLHGNGATP